MKDFYRMKPQSMFRCSDGYDEDYDGSMKDFYRIKPQSMFRW